MNKKLTIEAFILCYNEEKMIRHTLTHYAQFCDKITILDNHSTDKSFDFAYGFMMGLQKTEIEVKKYDTKNQIRDDAYMFLKNTCWKQSTADWVIVCDMDELLYHPEILTKLNEAKTSGHVIINTEGYNMYSETFPINGPPITQQIKTGVRALNFDKNIIFSPSLIQDINYLPGAHACKPVYKNNQKDIRPTYKFKLLHYKYLSYDYLVQKHNAYASRLSEYNKNNNFGGEYINGEAHVKECFRLLRELKPTKVI